MGHHLQGSQLHRLRSGGGARTGEAGERFLARSRATRASIHHIVAKLRMRPSSGFAPPYRGRHDACEVDESLVDALARVWRPAGANVVRYLYPRPKMGQRSCALGFLSKTEMQLFRLGSIRDSAYRLPRRLLSRTSVNKGWGQCSLLTTSASGHALSSYHVVMGSAGATRTEMKFERTR